MDKFHRTVVNLGYDNVKLLTDTFEGEGQKSLIKPEYKVEALCIIDRLTLSGQTMISNIWRNALKIVILPIQVWRLRRVYGANEAMIFHAIPMYYMVMCYFARIRYIGTPQGSEILVRLARSRIYKHFAIKAITGAEKIIVDSMAMKARIKSLCGVESILIKNGFDTSLAQSFRAKGKNRSVVLSIRGFHEMYRVAVIISARNKSQLKPRLDFVFVAKNKAYLEDVEELLSIDDKMHGMLSKESLYSLMSETILVISIPESDSSPRSVYESIFCGAIVAITYSGYYDELPYCMRQRIYLVNLDNETWFDEALKFAQFAVKQPYIPSVEALEMCDQDKLINKVIDVAYEL
jgi:hypothetical protein